MTSVEKSPLYLFANPRSIAFFGASNNKSSMGSIMLSSLMQFGYEGAIYPVHPKEKQVRGLKAYSNVMDLPESPDLAVLVLPTRLVSQTLEACGQKGITHAIVVSGGFKEVGAQGVTLEEELIQVADRYGIRLLGPNCLGIANPHSKFNPTPFPYMGSPGYIGLASQSGSFVTQMFDYLHQYRLGFSTAFSVGNEANTDLVDCMEYLAACPHTKVIGLYIEGINRGKAFMKTAKEIVPHKPIVALYVGGSETGKKAGFSHTGAMAGPDAVYDAVFRQCGIIRAHSLTELFDYCWALGGLPLPKGPRVAIQTNSGGPGATAADAVGRAGLTMPSLAPETIEKLKALAPPTASVNNPVDLTFMRNPLDMYTRVPEVLLSDPNTDILLIFFLVPATMVHAFMGETAMADGKPEDQGRQAVQSQIDFVCRLLKTSPKPVVGYTWRRLDESVPRGLMAQGIPIFPDPVRAARALAALVRYSRIISGERPHSQKS